MPIYYVYILRCLDQNNKETLYTGSTNNLIRRIEEHQKGHGAKYTRGKKLKIAYCETFITRSEAMKREYQIKSFTAEKKHELIKQFQNHNSQNSQKK